MSGPVVMVDDSSTEREITQSCYELAGGSAPWLEFEGGEPFLAYLDQVVAGEAPCPVLVLCDINMPALSGHDVIARARQRFAKGELRLVAFSNSDSARDRERALECGADEYITKPLEMGQLVEVFQRLLE